MAHPNFQYRFIQRPCRIHLNMRLLDRGHSTQSINTGHKGKGGTLQIVATAGTDETHVLSIVDTHLLKDTAQHRHDHLNFVHRPSIRHAVRLLEAHYCNFFHRLALQTGYR